MLTLSPPRAAAPPLHETGRTWKSVMENFRINIILNAMRTSFVLFVLARWRVSALLRIHCSVIKLYSYFVYNI